MSESIGSKSKWFYIVAPFCLLLICLGTVNVIIWLRSRPLEPLPGTETAVGSTTPLPPPTASSSTSHPTTPSPATTPGPTLTPSPAYTPPSYSDGDIIRLLGPPQNSTFAKAATISFYWQWPHPLTEDQRFNVYLLAEGQAMLLGTVKAPNLGDSYHLSVALEELMITADTLQWLVQLETTEHKQPLRISEVRFLATSTSTFPP